MTGPWRFGLLCSQTGVTAAVETTQLNASLLAIEHLNKAGGIAGRLIEPVIYDPASNPKQFAACAERLLGEDHIRLIFGCYMSSTRKAVLPLVEAYRGLLFYPTLYEGFEYSKHCIYTGAAPNQNSRQLAAYLFQTYGKRFLFIGSNYVYPYESNRIMSDLVRQVGGVVLDEIYVPLGAKASDFAKAIHAIGHLRPDVIFSTVVGRGTAMFYDAYHKAGFNAAKTPIASLTTSEAEVAEMSAAVACGHVTASPFFDILDTPAATAFVTAYRARFGRDAPVPAAAESAFFQIMLAGEAIERAGGDDPALILAALPDCELDAPQGRVRVDRDNNHTYLWPRVARLDNDGRFEIVRTSESWIKPDPYRVTQTLDAWSGGVELQAGA
jgi:branched-chain amino acid transport system substrate-binding protein